MVYSEKYININRPLLVYLSKLLRVTLHSTLHVACFDLGYTTMSISRSPNPRPFNRYNIRDDLSQSNKSQVKKSSNSNVRLQKRKSLSYCLLLFIASNLDNQIKRHHFFLFRSHLFQKKTLYHLQCQLIRLI